MKCSDKDELEQWAIDFRVKYGREIEQKIRRQFKVLSRDATRIFRNLDVTGNEYHSRINRIMAGMSYMRTCLQNAIADDTKWYLDYVKTCIEQEYNVIDYPDESAWTTFFQKHHNKRDKVLRRVKGILLQKLSKY